jgi:hypothetical protein
MASRLFQVYSSLHLLGRVFFELAYCFMFVTSPKVYLYSSLKDKILFLEL